MIAPMRVAVTKHVHMTHITFHNVTFLGGKLKKNQSVETTIKGADYNVCPYNRIISQYIGIQSCPQVMMYSLLVCR